MRVTQISLLLIILLFSGCNSNDSSTRVPYLMGGKSTTTTPENTKPITKTEATIALTAMEAKHQEALASIAAHKEAKLKALELERSKSADRAREAIITSENQRKIAIEKERQQTAVIMERERVALYRQYLIAGTILLLLLALLLYIVHRRNQALKLKIHEDTLRHKESMLSSQQHHERINKTLEILADQSTDKALKKELVKLLKEQNNGLPKLPG